MRFPFRGIIGTGHLVNDFLQPLVSCFLKTMLRIVKQRHQQERDDRRRRIDDQLTRVNRHDQHGRCPQQYDGHAEYKESCVSHRIGNHVSETIEGHEAVYYSPTATLL